MQKSTLHAHADDYARHRAVGSLKQHSGAITHETRENLYAVDYRLQASDQTLALLWLEIEMHSSHCYCVLQFAVRDMDLRSCR